MDHDPHIGFIVAAYAVAFVVIAAMILGIVLDYRALRRGLSRFGSVDRDDGERRAAPADRP